MNSYVKFLQLSLTVKDLVTCHVQIVSTHTDEGNNIGFYPSDTGTLEAKKYRVGKIPIIFKKL